MANLYEFRHSHVMSVLPFFLPCLQVFILFSQIPLRDLVVYHFPLLLSSDPSTILSLRVPFVCFSP